MRRIYVDSAAAQPLMPQARAAFVRCLAMTGNASALHAEGGALKKELVTARHAVAELFGAVPEEIIFTASTTEGTNTVVKTFTGKGPIVVTAGEHRATLKAAQATGNEVRVVPLERNGQWNPEAVVQAAQGAVLVSVALVNNETGVRQPVEALHKALKNRVYLHIDTAQAELWEECGGDDWGAEYITCGGSKMGAGFGAGVLYVRRGAPITPLVVGGGQEGARRSGTENIPAIAALGAVASLLPSTRHNLAARALRTRHALERALVRAGATILAQHTPRAPHIVAAHLPGRDAEELVLRADALGLAISAGSACEAGRGGSHVYEALGYPAGEVIRLSIPWNLTRWQRHLLVARLRRLLHTQTDYENSAHR